MLILFLNKSVLCLGYKVRFFVFWLYFVKVCVGCTINLIGKSFFFSLNLLLTGIYSNEPISHDLCLSETSKPTTYMFCKILTASDTSSHVCFLVLERLCFPLVFTLFFLSILVVNCLLFIFPPLPICWHFLISVRPESSYSNTRIDCQLQANVPLLFHICTYISLVG